MRPLGDALAEAGFPVRAVRLAGHDTSIEDLARTRWTDWFASVESGLARLRAEVARTVVAGLSLGAVLALHAAATHPSEVDGLVLCGTSLMVADRRVRWLPVLARLPWLPPRYTLIPKVGGRDIADPVMRAASPSYDALPLSAVAQFVRLQAVVRLELASVTQPVLALHGRLDHTAPLANVDLLRRGLGSRSIESHVLERSAHVITVDAEREQVARLAVDFVERIDAG